MTEPRTGECRFCGHQLTAGGFAITCPGAVPVPLPDYCSRPECRAQRDRGAIERAIAAGLIDP